MHRIGLTGGIGSGKSTVLALLEALGAATVDADALSRAATAPGGAAIPAITQRFGADFITPEGALDRARMRALAYADADARRALEAIVHPLVAQAMQARDAQARAEGRACLVHDIPLLAEAGDRWRGRLDRVLVVDCTPATQVARVMARSGLSRAEVEAIIAAQAPRALRLAAADIVIFNDGLSRDALASEVRQAARAFGL